MVSLELEARIDNLLATTQEETADIDIFAPISEREECPICMIPLPICATEIAFYTCCGKTICKGCIYTHWSTELDKGSTESKVGLCAFCRQPSLSETKQVKLLRRLMKNDNHQAFIQMGDRYKDGRGVFQSDTKSLEMYIRAGELGHAPAYGRILHCYEHGIVVEEDMSKAVPFYEIAAKKESVPTAHKHLARFHWENGNISTSIRHCRVAASAGDKEAMDMLMDLYKGKFLSKEELTQTLRAHQASINGMKSEDRDKAKSNGKLNLDLYYTDMDTLIVQLEINSFEQQ